MQIISRAQWKARQPTCSTPLPASQVQGIAVHYTGAASDEFGDPKDVFRAIQSYHMSPGGHDPTMPWCDVAYNFGWRDDTVLVGRGWDKRSAAQGTNAGNDHYIAIVYLGSDKAGRRDISPLEIKTLTEFVLLAEKNFKKRLRVEPHSFFHSTGCPGDELRAVIAMEPWRNVNAAKTVYPKGFLLWAAWRLGEGDFKKVGPMNMKSRPKQLPAHIDDAWWDLLDGPGGFLDKRKKK